MRERASASLGESRGLRIAFAVEGRQESRVRRRPMRKIMRLRVGGGRGGGKVERAWKERKEGVGIKVLNMKNRM